jgi:hypothetical protein
MRIRFSLRRLFLFVTVAGIALWLITLAISELRVRMAVRSLKASGVYAIEWSDASARPYFVSALKPLTSGEWSNVRTLGGLGGFEIGGAQATSAEALQCLRQSKGTLQHLHMRDCELNDDLVRAINDCEQLERFTLSNVSCDSRAIDFGTFGHLREAHVFGHPSDADLRWLGSQPQLERSTISSDRVTDELATTLVACKSLRELDLRKSSVARTGMVKLAKEASLTTLRFPPVELTEADIADIAACSVEWIDLQATKSQASWEPLLHSQNIKRVSLSIDYATALVGAEIQLKREHKLRVDFGPVRTIEELPDNPWPDAITVEGFHTNGIHLGAKSEVSHKNAVPAGLVPTSSIE